VPRLVNKIKNHIDDISLTEEYDLDGADVIIISYGITSRTILPAITKAKKKGIKIGYLRLKTVWPFPEEKIRKLSENVAGFVVPEMNLGQISLEVERCARSNARVKLVPNPGGAIHKFEDVLHAIEEVAHGK